MQVSTYTAGNENSVWTSTCCTVRRMVLHAVRCLALTCTDQSPVDVRSTLCKAGISPWVSKLEKCRRGMESCIPIILNVRDHFHLHICASSYGQLAVPYRMTFVRCTKYCGTASRIWRFNKNVLTLLSELSTDCTMEWLTESNLPDDSVITTATSMQRRKHYGEHLNTTNSIGSSVLSTDCSIERLIFAVSTAWIYFCSHIRLYMLIQMQEKKSSRWTRPKGLYRLLTLGNWSDYNWEGNHWTHWRIYRWGLKLAIFTLYCGQVSAI